MFLKFYGHCERFNVTECFAKICFDQRKDFCLKLDTLERVRRHHIGFLFVHFVSQLLPNSQYFIEINCLRMKKWHFYSFSLLPPARDFFLIFREFPSKDSTMNFLLTACCCSLPHNIKILFIAKNSFFILKIIGDGDGWKRDISHLRIALMSRGIYQKV